MIDTLIAGLALGCVLLFVPGLPAVIGVFGPVVVILGDFWVRFAILPHRNSAAE